MKRKRHGGRVFVVILLLLIIVLALIVNLTFTMSHSPHFFGYYVTVVADDDESMEPEISPGTAVISKALTGDTKIKNNTLVLCTLSDGSTGIRVVTDGKKNENGEQVFSPATLNNGNAKTDSAVPINNILGIPSYQSTTLASVINFVRSIYGVAILLILPCVILVIMLIVSIARSPGNSNSYDDDDDYYQEDSSRNSKYDDESNYLDDDDDYDTPLYTPSDENTSRFKRNRRIADNFRRKEVDDTSPYQQAVKRERTMQFKVHGGDMDGDGSNDFYDENPAERTRNIPEEAADTSGFTRKIKTKGIKQSHVNLDNFPKVSDIKVENYNPKPNYSNEDIAGDYDDAYEDDRYDNSYGGYDGDYEDEFVDEDDYDNNGSYDSNDEGSTYEERYGNSGSSYVPKHSAEVSRREAPDEDSSRDIQGDKSGQRTADNSDDTYQGRREAKPVKVHKKPNLDEILQETEKKDDPYVRPEEKDVDSVDDLIDIIKKENKNKE